MNFIKCTLSIPPKVTRDNQVVIGLCDEKKEKFLLIKLQNYQIENFISIFCLNVVFPVPLVFDFVAETLEKLKDVAGFKVQELRIEYNKYLQAKIIFDDGRSQEMRVEDALALAGRNNWLIKVQESLLIKNEGEIKPYKNQVLLEEMKKNSETLPDDFKIISSCGWKNIISGNN